MADPDDILRLLGDLAREGVVEAVDHASGTASVRFADDFVAEKVEWMTPRSGATRVWSAPVAGEQVLVLSLEGRTNKAVIVGSLSSNAHPHPAADASVVVTFGDGARLSYDPAAHALALALPEGATLAVTATGGTTWSGKFALDGDLEVTGKATVAGDVVGAGKSLKDHVHLQVQPGQGVSGKPQ